MDAVQPEVHPERDWYDDEPRPRGRRRRWVVLVLLLLVVAAAGFYLSWTHRAEQRLAELVEGLKRNGEPVAPEDLLHPPIPAESDAAIDLLAAAALLKDDGSANSISMIDFNAPLSRKDVAAMRKQIESERKALEKVRGARGKSDADWKIPYQSPMLSTLLPHLNTQRGLANLCRTASVLERVEGNDAAAVEHLRDVLAIGRASENQPIMVGHLVAVGVKAIASEQLGRMAPDLAVSTGPGSGGRAATPEQVRATIGELLDDGPGEAAVRGSFRGERVMVLDTMKLLADRKLDANAVLGSGFGGRGGFPPVPRGLILSDAAIVVGQNTDTLNAYEGSPDYPTYRQKAPPFPASVRKSPQLHFLAGALMPSYDRFIVQHYRGKTDRRLAATALALRLYAVEHDGKYPKSLDELVPKYLPAVPKDSFAAGDKPLCYSAADPAAPIVYSVGENGADDGGSRAPSNPRRNASPSRWDQKDAVLETRTRPLQKSAEQEKQAEAEKGAEG